MTRNEELRLTESNSDPFFKKAELFFEIEGDSSILRAVNVALKLESDERKYRGKRCEMRVFLKESNLMEAKLHISFQSNDIVSLRASFNSNLRLLASALKTIGAVVALEKM